MDIEDKKYQQLRHRLLKRKFQVARNQARYRLQEWTLTEEEYFEIWERIPQSWMFSGKTSEDYNLSRIDMDLGWTPENVHVIPRREMLARQGEYVRELNARKRG